MASQAEGNYINDAILWEEDARYSRKNVMVEDGQTLVAGQVVGLITTSSTVGGYDADQSNGLESVYGILYADVTASGQDEPGVVFVRNCIAKKEGLTWVDEANDEATGIAELEALGIVVRDTA